MHHMMGKAIGPSEKTETVLSMTRCTGYSRLSMELDGENAGACSFQDWPIKQCEGEASEEVENGLTIIPSWLQALRKLACATLGEWKCSSQPASQPVSQSAGKQATVQILVVLSHLEIECQAAANCVGNMSRQELRCVWPREAVYSRRSNALKEPHRRTLPKQPCWDGERGRATQV